jgi:hypothetical protein
VLKGNPADVCELSEDIGRCIGNHPDAITHNPDIARKLLNLRDKTRERYERIAEKQSPSASD